MILSQDFLWAKKQFNQDLLIKLDRIIKFCIKSIRIADSK